LAHRSDVYEHFSPFAAHRGIRLVSSGGLPQFSNRKKEKPASLDAGSELPLNL